MGINIPELSVFTAFHDWSIISSAVTTTPISIAWRKREAVRERSTTFVFFFKCTISRYTLIFAIETVYKRSARFEFHQLVKRSVHEIHVTFTGHLSTRIVNFCRVITGKTLIWAINWIYLRIRSQFQDFRSLDQNFWSKIFSCRIISVEKFLKASNFFKCDRIKYILFCFSKATFWAKVWWNWIKLRLEKTYHFKSFWYEKISISCQVLQNMIEKLGHKDCLCRDGCKNYNGTNLDKIRHEFPSI